MSNDFENAGKKQRGNFLSEIWSFLGHHKKWWIAPIIAIILLLGLLITLGSSGAAPFIYTFF